MRENPGQAVGFVPKMICYRKNWRQNLVDGLDRNVAQRPDDVIDFTEDYMPEDEDEDDLVPVFATIWHRDISAAKLILYKGRNLPLDRNIEWTFSKCVSIFRSL